MATLFNTRISDTYTGLIKTIDNAVISATLKELSDGAGNGTGLSLNNAGDFKVNAILEFGSLKDSGENIIISKFVDAADGIGNNDNDTSIPTSAAVISYVGSVITAEDLDFRGDDSTVLGDVDLNSQAFIILGTANEIETSVTSAGGNTLKIGIPSNPVLTGIVTATTFSGDLNGTINTATTAVTQSAGDNSTKVATTAYVDTLDAASDLDFSGDSGSGDVTLNSQTFAITGTTNQVITNASGQTLNLSLPTTVHRNLQGNVTGNVTGDLTGNSAGIHTGAVIGNVTGDLTGTVLTTTQNSIETMTGLSAVGTTGVNTTFSSPIVASEGVTGNVAGNLTGNVLGNVTGDLTGNVTSTSVLANGVTATTQGSSDSSTKVATTAFVKSLDNASDLDFSGNTGTGDVNLNTQSLAVTGVTNEISTNALNQGLTVGFPTGGAILPDGSTATTQASSDDSTKIATTAYVKGLNNASDLDFTDGTTAGDVNLNTQSLSILGTDNQVVSTVANQSVTLSLPSSINVNSASATILQTARDISLTGEASGTISSFNGSANVSGAVALDNDSVTAKVLTGLASPTATNILASDSILQAFGKTQSQLNTLAGGLRFMGTWNASTNDPTLASGGGESASGTTTGTTANKLVDSGGGFTSGLVGDQVVNQASGATATVTNFDSTTVLSLSVDIMVSGQEYTIDNSPFLTQGHYYVVSVGGTSSLNGLTNWAVGDWVIAGATNVWEKLDHTQVDGTGTVGNITKWSSTNVIADSIMAESGSTISVSGGLDTTQAISSGGDFSVNTDKFTVNATTGAASIDGTATIGDTLYVTEYIQHLGDTSNNIRFQASRMILQSKASGSAKIDLHDNGSLFLNSGGGTALTLDTSQNATFGGDITVTGNQYFNGNFIEGDSKEMFTYNDAWLRINGGNDFTNGIYCGTSVLRLDGEFQIGASGTYAKITSTGNATFAGNILINGGVLYKNSGTLEIKAEIIRIKGVTTNEDLAVFTENGSVSLNYDNSKKFETTAGGTINTGTIDSTGTITITGANGNVGINTDTGKLLLGASYDLQLYHDGSNSYIKDSGTGTLNIQGSTQVLISGANGEIGVQYVENAGVGLRHNNVQKLGTSSTGITISGALSIGSSGTSRFTDTNAFPLQLSRGLDVDVYGANGCSLGIGSLKGSTYIDAARFSSALAVNGTDGTLSLQTLGGGSYTTALQINSSQNATFAEDVTVKGSHLYIWGDNTAVAGSIQAYTSGGGLYLEASGTNQNIGLIPSGTGTVNLTGGLIGTTATFAGSVTAAGNSNSFGGTTFTTQATIFSFAGGPQLKFLEPGSSYSEAMRIIRSSDELGFHYGENANEEAFTINSSGNATAHKGLKVNTTISTLGKLSVKSESGANTFYNNIQCVPSDATTGGLFIGSNVTNDAIMVTGAYYANAGNYTPTATSASIINMFSGNIVFRTNDSLTVGTNYVPTERMRIDSAGNVSIKNVDSNGASQITPTLSLSFDGGSDINYNIGYLNFLSNDTSTSSSGGVGGIGVYAEEAFNTSFTPSYMSFYTHQRTNNNGTTLGNVTERMRIDSSGNLILNQATSRLKGGGTTSGKLELLNSDSTSYIVVNGSANAAANDIGFVTNSALAMTITSGGDMQFNGNGLISTNTSDGSDNGSLKLAGGGAFGDTRGSSIELSGNENGNGGLLQLRAGDGSVGGIRFYTGGSERMRLGGRLLSFGGTTGINEIRSDSGSNKFAIGNMGDASSQMMVSSRGFLTFNVSNTGSALDATERIRIDANGFIYNTGNGTNNVSFGSGAGNVANMTGSSNTFVGTLAGDTVVSGFQNIGIGYNALEGVATGSGGIAIGIESGNFTSGNGNIALGYAANGSGAVSGSRNISIGDATGYNVTSGGNNILIGTNAGRTGSQTPQSLGGVTTESNQIQLGNNSHTSFKCKISLTVTSDKRDKTNLKEIPLGLDFVSQLKPTSFEFKKERESNKADGIERYGFLAQDILELEGDNPVIIDNENLDSLKYTSDHLIPVLVKAIQELTDKVKMLENKCQCKN